MNSIFELTGPVAGPASGGTPTRLVVMLHGYGADGNDLIDLAQAWEPLLPDALFVAPNAPFPCDGNPFGFQWFGISNLDPDMMLAGVRASAPILQAFLDETLQRTGMDEARTALVGFSQGTMMALHVGLRWDTPFAGIVGYSGALPGRELLGEEIKSRPPVLLVHGDSDPIVPVAALRLAREGLEAAGVPVEAYVARGVEHGIDRYGLELGGQFLTRVLA